MCIRDSRGIVKERFDDLLQVPVPAIEFHPRAGRARRADRETCFLAFSEQTQAAFRQYVAHLCQILDIPKRNIPDKDRFFHMSVWNSFDGDPFRSIGDITQNDFGWLC
eukprot:TRINITY_DN49841_c0_g1_i1.p1 TRINITY_DN49841_c0_g1~~TRINITY_DN49841_c0_g1_i1.p1  ORF type:complete len:108 (+),score=17.96 TRINITY_DN49841_c0_g1_i1:118-441(+)